MNTKLFTLFIVALASCARAWDVSYSVSAVNDSGCTLGVSSIQYSIHSNSGGPDFYATIYVSVSVPPHSSQTISGDVAWPVNTLPGSGLTLVNGAGNGETVTGADGGASWPGGTTMIVSGSIHLQNHIITVTVPANNTASDVDDTYFFASAPGVPQGTVRQDAGAPADELDLNISECDEPVTWSSVVVTNNIVTPPQTNSLPPVVTNSPLSAVPPVTNAPTSPVSPATNTILWSPGGGGATEYTLEQAGQGINQALWTANNQEHADLTGVINAINGAKNQAHSDAQGINTAIGNGTTQTHADLSALHNDSLAIAGAITNLGRFPTSLTNGVSTNAATETTQRNVAGSLVGISNILSGLTDVTNMDVASELTLGGMSNLLAGISTNLGKGGTNLGGLNLTNYNLESTQTNVFGTLAGLSNLVASLLTNTVDTNHIAGEMPAGYAAAEAGTNALLSLMPEAPDGGGQVGSALSGWTVQIPYGGGYTIDLNPFHLAWVASLAAFVRSLVFWIGGASLLYANCDVLLKALQSLGATRQASASGQSVFGTNANLATALIMAALITLVMLGVPYFALNWYLNHTALGTSFQNLVSGNPFQNGAASAVAQAVWMADQFFPLSWMVSCVVSGITFRVALGAVLWTVQTVTRFLVG